MQFGDLNSHAQVELGHATGQCLGSASCGDADIKGGGYMEDDNSTFLFGEFRIATVKSGEGRFQHSFGGPHDRKGTSRDDCNGILIHLLHRIDLTDPLVPLKIPGMRWMPFYYCFDFRVNELGYRLVSDDELVVFFPDDDPNVSTSEEWPDKNYPLEFPRSAIRVESLQYDPTIREDAYDWAGVFGISKLSKEDQRFIKQQVANRMAGLRLKIPKTERDFDQALIHPFGQGKPVGPCLNPECSNRKVRSSLNTIALMPAEPIKGIHTFGRWGDGVQLIFQKCPKCHTIRVSNQSS